MEGPRKVLRAGAGPVTARGPSAAVAVRPARLSDVATLVDLYLGQADASRALYHPFPFDAGKLRLLFSYMTLERPLARLLSRVAPGWAAVVLVATAPEDGRVVGYGTVRFDPDSRSDLRAKFGYLVGDAERGRGVGTRLMGELIRTGQALGALHLGGTVLEENLACQRVLAKYGFEVGSGADPDLFAPGRTNLRVELRVGRPPTGGARAPPGSAEPLREPTGAA